MNSGALTTSTGTTIIPVSPSSIYELGRDYTITKNIKKNTPKKNMIAPVSEVKKVAPVKEIKKAPVSKKTQKSTKNK